MFNKSLNLVYRIFNFEVYTFVMIISIDANGALLLVITKPTPVLSTDNVEIVFVDPSLNKIQK